MQDDSTTSASSRSKKIGEGGEATEKLTYLYRSVPVPFPIVPTRC